MKVIKQNLSEEQFLHCLNNIDFNNKKEKIISLGNHLYIRAYVTKTNVFFYRSSKSKKLERIGTFNEEVTYKEAISKAIEFEMLNNPSNFRYTKSLNYMPNFEFLSKIWLKSKKHLARYPNLRKSVEYLKPLNSLKLNEINNIHVKKTLLEIQTITPYKIHETLEVLCRIMDLAIEDEYIKNHNFRLLIKSDSIPKHVVSSGYKYVEFHDLASILEDMSKIPTLNRCMFLMQIFTCLRVGECRKLKFSYFDLKQNLIAVDGQIMKVKTPIPFRVPLSKQMLQLFNFIKEFHEKNGIYSEYLFPNVTQTGIMAERDISQHIKIATNGRVHAHGFRKTARSYFAEKGYQLEVSAMCLAHQLNTGADRCYQKSDLLKPRRVLITDWNNDVERIAPPAFKELLKK